MFGNQVVTATDAPVTGEPTGPIVDSTEKAPWTLLMGAGTGSYSWDITGGVFTSDGSAVGTSLVSFDGWLFSSYSDTGVRFKTTSDLSKAYFYRITGSSSYSYFANSVGISDGSASGTIELMKIASSATSYIPANFSTVVDGKLILAGSSYYYSGDGKILVSNGTVGGTSLQTTDFSVPGTNTITDTAHQAVWFAASTGPYGGELTRFSYADSAAPMTAMVKDIYSGSSSGLYNSSYVALQGALLPNGKLVFNATDGVHGYEPWVSDGTEAGTFMLADLYSGGGDGTYYYSSQFTSFGSKVVIKATVYNSTLSGQTVSAGIELIFTDGTSAGTTIMDINPGYADSDPTIIGQANSLLYFTATAPNSSNVSTQGIFSTNGSTFTRLADINSSASMLGANTSKAYFQVSDASHGSELWVADLGSGGFNLVKDILPGSGSSLAANSINPLLIGDKLLFNAYTSATQQGLFLSNGTEAGTVQLSSTVPTISKVVGTTLVFGNANGVYGVSTASAAPIAVNLASSLSTISSYLASPMQADADQVFFRTSTGDLYATNGSVAGTVKLSGSVESFKVVAENAMFFVKETSTTDSALWYSDGTAAGTHRIEALPANFNYDMENAVAIHTVGVAA